MRAVAARKFVLSSVVGLLALTSGCAVLDVEMTSYPEVVHAGDKVTFDIKLFNRSPCPIEEPVALLIPFIPAENFLEELFGEIPDDAPPEVKRFIREIQRFFDRLCVGEEPPLPEFPEMTGSCGRGADGEIVCNFTGPLAAEEGNNVNMTFSGLDDRLHCQLDQGTMSCQLRVALPATAANGNAAGATEQLDCIDFGNEIGIEGLSRIAVCFVGNFPRSIQDLAGHAMAQGSIALKARGVGFVRNIVIGIADAEDDLGVCQGGDDAGDPCDPSDSEPCYNGTCVRGICDGGGNNGLGCDPTLTQCPDGSCEACDQLAENGFMPIDCTTTLIEPDPAPVMSPMGLAALAVALVLLGSVWIQRRQRKQS